MALVERTTGTLTTTQTDVNAVTEVQNLHLNDFGSTDTFTLTHGGTTTSALTYSTDMSAVIAAGLNGLASIGTSGCSVVIGADPQHYTVTFNGSATRGKQMGAITVTDAVGWTNNQAVVETTSGRAAVTYTMALGSKFAKIPRIRVGLFEDAATNDLIITDAAGRSVVAWESVDFNVSAAMYDKFVGWDGYDQSYNAAADTLQPMFESPLTIVVRGATAGDTGSVTVFTEGGQRTAPQFRERTTGTIQGTAGGVSAATIRLGAPVAKIRRIKIHGWDTSSDFTLTDAYSKNVFTKSALNAATASLDFAVGYDGVDQAANAVADVLPGVFKSPITVAVANGGTSTTGHISLYVEN